MYFAILIAVLAAYVWPERNIADVPFAELTLKMIATTVFALWLGYLAIVFVIDSFKMDSFWPWKWTLRIVQLLCIRAGLLGLIALALWGMASVPKYDRYLDEYPIITGIVLLIAVSWAICVDDEELLPGPAQEDLEATGADQSN